MASPVLSGDRGPAVGSPLRPNLPIEAQAFVSERMKTCVRFEKGRFQNYQKKDNINEIWYFQYICTSKK